MAKKKLDLWEEAKSKQTKDDMWIRNNSQFSSANKPKKLEVEPESYFDEDGNKVIIEERIVYKEKPGKFKKDKSKAKSSGLIAIVVAIIIAVIAIPIILLFGLSTWAIDSVTKMQSDIGFAESTEFTIKHEETGKYLKDPTYQGQQVLATDADYEEASKFHFADIDGNLYIESTRFYNGSQMSLSINDGTPVWQIADDEHPLSIYKKDNENLYSIKFLNNGNYLTLNENSNQLALSNKEDWFEFYALPTENDLIKTGSQFDQFFYRTHAYNENEFNYHSTYDGISSSPIIIQDIETGMYMNSFGNMQMELDTDTNMFLSSGVVQSSETAVPDNWLGELIPWFYLDGSFQPIIDDNTNPLYLGSYQNLSLVPHFKETGFQDLYYPLLVASDDENEVSFEQFAYGHKLEYTNWLAWGVNYFFQSWAESYYQDQLDAGIYDGTEHDYLNAFKGQSHINYIPEAVIWLVPNPTNWTQRMLYFPLFDKYVQVEGTKLISKKTPDNWKETYSTKKWDEDFNPTYFKFSTVGHDNPEFFEAFPMLDSQSKTYFHVNVTNYKEISDITINVFDWNEFKNKVLMGASADDLNEFFAKPLNSKTKVPKKNGSTIKVDDLEKDRTYMGTVTVNRVKDDVGKHTSTRFIPFLFGNSWVGGGCGGGNGGGGGNIDFPDIDPPEPPELIQPMDEIMWNSTEVGHHPADEPPTNPTWPSTREGNEPGPKEAPHGIDIKESDTKAEASVLFQNGKYSNDKLQYNSFSVNLHELDDSGVETGEVIKSNTVYKPTADEALEYHFVFENLKASTNYNAVLVLDGREQNQTTTIVEDIAKDGDTEFVFNTERSWPELTIRNSVAGNSWSSSIYVSDYMENDRIKLTTMMSEDDGATYNETEIIGGTVSAGSNPITTYQDLNDSDGMLMSDFTSLDGINTNEDEGWVMATITAPVETNKMYEFYLTIDVSAYYDGWDLNQYWLNDGEFIGNHLVTFKLGEYPPVSE